MSADEVGLLLAIGIAVTAVPVGGLLMHWRTERNDKRRQRRRP